MSLNQELFSYLYGFAHRHPAFDGVIVFLATDLGLIAAFALVYFLLYAHPDRKQGLREFIIIGGSAFSAWIIAHIIKFYYPAARPGALIETVLPLFTHGTGVDSFPSGHATFYAALATATWFYHRRLAYALAAVAFLIGLARVMSGIHSPLDILAGYLLGSLTALLVHFLYSKKRGGQ